MKITDILNALKGTDAAESTLTRWLEIRDRIKATEQALTDTEGELTGLLLDAETPLEELSGLASAAKARKDLLTDRLKQLRGREDDFRAEVFGPANTVWSRFLALKTECQALAEQLAEKGLEAAGLDRVKDPGAWSQAVAASKFVRAENRESLCLVRPGSDLGLFLEQTLPAIVDLRPSLEARRDWWRAVLSGKKKFGNGPPRLSGAGVLEPASKPTWREDPPEEPSGSQSDAAALEMYDESTLARRRKKERAKAVAEGTAPPQWQGESIAETRPVKTLA